MKNFKKFICCFSILICLCFGMASFIPHAQIFNAFATSSEEEILINFVVENDGNEISVSLDDLSKNNFTNFDDAFTFMANSINENEILAINFNSFIASETIKLYQISNLSSIVLSGSIIADDNLFEILGENALMVKCEDITLSLSSQTDYAFFITNNLATLSFGKSISLNDGYIANAGEHILKCHESISASTKLKIAVPAKNDTIVLNNFSDGTLENNETDNFKFVPTAEYYKINTSIINNNIISNADIKISFETNNGSFVEGFEPEETLSSNLNFPNSQQLVLPHFDLVGWFGKIEEAGENYYFDSEMLDAFINSEASLLEINEYFVKNLDEVNLNNAFTSYNSENNHAHIDLFITLEKMPTFVAGWNDSLYTISFNTNSELILNDLSFKFGEEIVLPSPNRAGFEFKGWFVDSSLETEFDLTNMPDTDISLFAKWAEKTYTLIFKDGEMIINTVSGKLNDQIVFPNIESKPGFEFKGWYVDEDLNTEFNDTTLISENQTVYAKWQRLKYSIIINSMGGNIYSPIEIEFETDLSNLKINVPVKTGYEFDGWFLDRNLANSFELTGTMPAKSFTIFAKWNPILFRLSFETNNSSSIISRTYYYGETLDLPTPTKVIGKIFAGWFEDQSLTSAFATKTMPARNLTIYAKWTDKQTITIDGSVQTYPAEDINSSFGGFSNLTGFTIEYKIGEVWTVNKPTSIGTYDVRISRSEDDVFKAFETIIYGGFVLTGPELNLNWLIIILFIIAGIELISVVIIRQLIHLKKDMAIAVLVPFFSYMLEVSQLVLLIISGVLALFMFIMLIYQIVLLNKTLPKLEIKTEKGLEMAANTAEENDNFVNNNSESQVEAIGTKYSAEDIQALLYNDNYKESHLKNKVDDEPEQNNKDYISAVQIARERSIDESYLRDELEDVVEIQDINGQRDFTRNYSSEIYEHEFDDWRNKTQSDIPDDAK